MTRLAVAASILALTAGAAYAQAPAAPIAKSASLAKSSTTMTTTSKTAPVAHTAASIDCSKQADAKGLKGKARKHFRSSCKAAAKAG